MGAYSSITTRTPAMIIPFGTNAGKSIRVVSHRWISWLSRQSSDAFIYDGVNWADEAKKELARRGTSYDSIPTTYHAIDRFTQHYLDKWDDTNIGVASFVAKLGDKAWEEGKTLGIEKSDTEGNESIIHKYYNQMTFVFHCTSDYQPIVLKTIT